ncbi:MAG: alpha-2-macroglobulin family protein, partial [Planctomycetota bacterium]
MDRALRREHDEVVMTVGFPVNRHGVIVKSAAGRTVVFGQDRVDGTPIAGMRVRVLGGDNKPQEGLTGEDGLLVLTGTGTDSFLVASKGDDFAFANVRTYGWDGAASRYYVVCDRPIYRPNQRVQFKIVHRTQEGADLKIAKDLRVRVRVLDPKGNEVHAAEKEVNEFGSLDDSFRLGDEPPLGTYRIQIDPLSGNVPAVRDWRAGRGQFRVDEYRKPEFKVGVKFDQGHYVQGGLLKATIAADYYFGSPVPDAKVTWNIRRRRHWGGGVKHRYHWYRWYVDDYGMRPRHYGEDVGSGTGKLDENGRLVLEVPLKEWDWDATYSVQANVTDLSRRTVTGAGGVRVNRAEFSLGVTLDRYVYKPGDTVRVTVKAERPDGTPVKDRAVEILLNRRYWRGKEYEETTAGKFGGITHAEGVAEIAVPVKQAGSFVIVARSSDRHGNKTWTKRWVWIADRTWNGGYVKWDGVDVVPDKASYAPGETATFLVSSQHKDLHVLLTLESSRIHTEEVVKLNGHTATVSIKLDDKTMVPNVWATVTTLHKGSVYRRSRSVMVDPSNRFLSVEIKPSRDKYRPRDPAAVEIVTRDKEGKPVEAEVFLSIVDEAIYALQPEYAQDIRQFFVPKRRNRVPTRTSLDYWQWGEAGIEKEVLEDEDGGLGAPAAGIAGRGGGARALERKRMKSGYAETEVRSKFADTMYWAASVRTDEHGRATVRIDQVADNLTTWRVTARAASKGGLVGQGHRTFLVRKDVIVRLHAPRFYTQGDKASVSAVVHNYLDNPKQVKIEVAAEGLDLRGAASQVVEIGAQDERRFDWPVIVRTPGKAVISVKALTDEESDAMKRTVPLLPHGSLQWTSSTHLVKGALDTNVTLPKDAIQGASELTVVVSPTHAATVLDALDYLADYPYGCVEQTMSRFLPSTITAQVLRKLNLSRPELEKELPDMISAGLQRLYNFQHNDG